MRSSNNVQAIVQIFNRPNQDSYRYIDFIYRDDFETNNAKKAAIKQDFPYHFYHCFLRKNNFDRNIDDYVAIIRIFENFVEQTDDFKAYSPHIKDDIPKADCTRLHMQKTWNIVWH
jgi:hypothetical protein